MSYEVTAIRKRPHTFESLVGQEFVVSALTNSIANGNFARAYLFSGPHGVGKTSVARILAAALNCEHGPTPHPCCRCASCKEIIAGNSLDVTEIDGASNTSVSDIRVIKDEILFPPNSSRFKIYIIDEVHMLSNSAFNALLKTIEEPPEHVVFIFATTEVHKVLPTIRSRCQQFHFRLIDTDVIKNLLKDRCLERTIRFEDDALLWIAKEAAGSVRDAYMLFDQILTFSDGEITLQKIRENMGVIGFDRINDLAVLMAEGKEKEVLETASAILSAGVSIEQLINDLAEYFRGILLIKTGIEKESLIGVRKDRYHAEAVGAFSVSGVENALSLLFSLYRDIRFSVNPRFELELVLSRLSRLKDFLTKTEILEELGILKQQLLKQISLHGSSVSVPEKEREIPAKTTERPPAEDLLSSPAETVFRQPPAGFAQRSEQPLPATAETHSAGGTAERPLTSKEILPLLIRIAVENKKPLLKTVLSEIKKAHADGTRLTLYCKNDYGRDAVCQSTPLLEREVFEKTGIAYKIDAETAPDLSANLQTPSEAAELELFRQVFNAEPVGKNPVPSAESGDLNF